MTATRQGIIASAIALLLVASACGSAQNGSSASQSLPEGPKQVVVVGSYPHDPGAYTQGLELADDAHYYESTGRYGRSEIRKVELVSGRVVESRSLPSDEFGEGLTLVGDRIVQLTWKEQTAHVYEVEGFQLVGSFGYEGEGWGICFDGSRLITSDGSASLAFRNPETFRLLGRVEVSGGSAPVDGLNELECVGDSVFANVYGSDTILEIDPGNGTILSEIDASGLLEPDEAAAADVLNGIAYDASREVFLLTGKLWPKVFEVRFESTG